MVIVMVIVVVMVIAIVIVIRSPTLNPNQFVSSILSAVDSNNPA